MKKKCIVVAPYCPPGRFGLVALGAAAKQKAVLGGLISNGLAVVLLNSGHQEARSTPARLSRLSVGNQNVAEYSPTTLSSRPVGKLLQLVQAFCLGRKFQHRYEADLIWIYNTYAFEVLFTLGVLSVGRRPKVVLELEDMPVARQRVGSGSLKTWLDYVAFKLIFSRVDAVTLVHAEMESRLPNHGPRVYQLPVLIRPENLVDDLHDEARNVAGYFGGLSREKGADLILKVIERDSSGFSWIVCGSGELASDFSALAVKVPHKLRFYHALPEAEFRLVYSRVGVFVNMHLPLSNFGKGIFQYKLLEAVAARKIVLSTPTEGCPSSASGGIYWLNGDAVEACLEALEKMEVLRPSLARGSEIAAEWVRGRYSATECMRGILRDLSLYPL